MKDPITATLTELWRALNAKEQRRALKSAYRKVGKQVRDIAREEVRAVGFKTHGTAPLEDSLYTWAYTRGSGFMVTARPHKRKGMHLNSRKQEKPVLWFLQGTKGRRTKTQTKFFIRTRKGHSTGRISRKRYQPERAEDRAVGIVESQLAEALERNAYNILKRKGLV